MGVGWGGGGGGCLINFRFHEGYCNIPLHVPIQLNVLTMYSICIF